ncbi:hypothetical protein QP028_06260 [Corynebacterium suedekumii]|nr:hypothetical protein QP028_06260 [Corynebacterium suedekumii]
MYKKRVVSLSAAVMLGLSTAVVPVVSPDVISLPTASAQTAVLDPSDAFASDHGSDVLNHLYGGVDGGTLPVFVADGEGQSYQIGDWIVEGFGVGPLPSFQMSAYTQINPASRNADGTSYLDATRPGAEVGGGSVSTLADGQPFADGTYIVDKNLVPVPDFNGTTFSGDGWIHGLGKPVQELGARLRTSTDYAADVQIVMKVSDTHSKAEYVKSANVQPWNGWWVPEAERPYTADVSGLEAPGMRREEGVRWFVCEDSPHTKEMNQNDYRGTTKPRRLRKDQSDRGKAAGQS